MAVSCPTGSAKHAMVPVSRDVEGKLWAGHKDFEWLHAVFTAVMATHKSLPPGDFLWELIHPRDPKDNTPIKPASGKYRIKLFIMVRGRGGAARGGCAMHVPIASGMWLEQATVQNMCLARRPWAALHGPCRRPS